MPVNRNAMMRYLELDRCLRNPGRRFQIADLINACNTKLTERYGPGFTVSRKTIYNDLEFMRSSDGWSAPIEKEKDGKKVYHRYEDRDFSINNAKVNDAELNQIKSALVVLQRFKGMPQFKWINEIIAKLESSFDVKEDVDYISFQHNEFLQGLEHLEDLFNAIVYKKKLVVEYRAFTYPEPLMHEISPYYLKQFNNRWFLFGHNHETGLLQNLSLDRISNVNSGDGDFMPCNTDWEDYFYDIYGVSRPYDGEVEEIELWLSQSQAPYIKTKPIHGSQKYTDNEDGSAHVKLKLIPNFEFKKLILSYGAGCKVLAPSHYVDLIREEFEMAKGLYHSGDE
ncbi:MAG: helix-turn-helix transcriptional regulator [Cryomorphaceae bacterium]